MQTPHRQIPSRLADLAERPAWARPGGRYRPKGMPEIQKRTADKLVREGLAERKLLGVHDALVITEAGKAVLAGKPAVQPATRPAAAPPFNASATDEPTRRPWWVE